VSALTLGLSGMLAATAVPVAAASVATAPRVYEQVSPADKHGADVAVGVKASAGGDDVAYMSLGAYGDTPANVVATYYAAHRSADGWTTESLVAPSASPAPALTDAVFPNDLSDDLRTAYYTPNLTSLAAQDLNNAYDAFSVSGGVATWLTPSVTLPDTGPGDSYYRGRSADGRHVVIESTKQLMPSVPGGTSRVYERVDDKLRVASILPASAGNPTHPDAVFGDGRSSVYTNVAQPGDARAISADGRRIFFTVDGQLYVRADGRTTDLISASHVPGAPREAVNGAAARFVAASTLGDRVFFTAAARLTGDAPATGGLYAYDLDNDVMSLVAADASASQGFVGVLRSAPDGSRIFFVSSATLGSADATAGAMNLFAGGDGAPRFIGTLNGSDTGLWSWGEFANTAAVSPDGRKLALSSAGSLAPFDNGGRAQVYLYDIDAGLTCVSCPPAGQTADDEALLRDVPGNQQGQPRTFAADGTLFFQTGAALVPEDGDDALDVYAYDGALHVASAGTQTDAHIVDVSADGRDLFIRTHDALAASDQDGGYADVYDARIGGGFPPPAPAPSECEGAACRGPLPADPPPPAAPASLGAQDTSAAAAPDDRPLTFSVGAIGAAARSTAARTGKLSLSVKVSDTAVLAAKATATLRGAGKATTVAAATGTREGAGTVRLTLALSAKARSALKRSGRLTVHVTVSASDTKTTKRATVALRTRKAAR
jgi:hypothetical protein